MEIHERSEKKLPTVWYFRTVPTVWYFRTVPTVWYFRTVPTVWYFRTVTTVWYFRTVPTVGYFIDHFIFIFNNEDLKDVDMIIISYPLLKV
jgi:hypothetical protein